MCFSDGKNPDHELQPIRPAPQPQRRAGNAPRAPAVQRPAAARVAIDQSTMEDSILLNACESCQSALRGNDFAILGGAALKLLGSPRNTADIDLLVPDGRKKATIAALRSHSDFGADSGSLMKRMWYTDSRGRNHNIDILEPSMIGGRFDPRKDILNFKSVNLLRPEMILNYKIVSYEGREKQNKKAHDRHDILWLIGFLAKKGIVMGPRDVPACDADFLDEIIALYPASRKDWQAIGLLQRSRSRSRTSRRS